jgi:hypothetical protein
VVPPSSDRVSRAPPYSWIPARPYPYGAVTRSGASFQTLPVRALRPLAWSAFARRYWRSRGCFPFLRLLRYFSSPGSPRRPMDSAGGTARRRWVAPFGDLGITGRSPLPRAFRSVPRPSSPLGAKASTRCPCLARRAPGAEPATGPVRRRPRAEHTRASKGAPRTTPSLQNPAGGGPRRGRARFGQSLLATSSRSQKNTRGRPGLAPVPEGRAAPRKPVFPARRHPNSQSRDLGGPALRAGGLGATEPLASVDGGGPGLTRTADLTLIRRAL